MIRVMLVKYINLIFYSISVLSFSGCVVGHGDYKRYLDMNIGESIYIENLSKSPNAGQLIRSDYLIQGEGLTHITTLDSGVLRYHFSGMEILPNYSIKDYVGKCLIYYDVDPKTHIIIAWGFDEGGNPLSCRTFP
jgi:hypothetical protein